MMTRKEKLYIFRNRRTGMVLGVRGMTAVQLRETGGKDQIWRTIPAAGTTVRIRHEVTGLYLSVLGTGENGKGVCISEALSTVEQIWKITTAEKGYRKITHVNSGRVADIRDISDEEGAAVQLWEFVHGENQEWIAEEVKPGKQAGTDVGFERAGQDALPCAKR